MLLRLVAAPGSGAKPGSRPAKVKPAPTTVVTAPAAVADEDIVVPSGFGNDLRALPTGFVAFALRPFPWQHGETVLATTLLPSRSSSTTRSTFWRSLAPSLAGVDAT